jgi:hypothetical protein
MSYTESDLRDALGKLIDPEVELLQVGPDDRLSLAAPDLKQSKPALDRLTAKYGQLEGFEADVLGRVPVLLYANGPMTVEEIAAALAMQSAALAYKDL